LTRRSIPFGDIQIPGKIRRAEREAEKSLPMTYHFRKFIVTFFTPIFMIFLTAERMLSSNQPSNLSGMFGPMGGA
jgi:hypothetical protein